VQPVSRNHLGLDDVHLTSPRFDPGYRAAELDAVDEAVAAALLDERLSNQATTRSLLKAAAMATSCRCVRATPR
jgi:hypothetical protein